MADERLSLQELIKTRQQPSFFGRKTYIDFFSTNLESNLSQVKLLINVFGQGGVGKSTLLERFKNIATEKNCIALWSDHSELDLLSVMSKVAKDFEAQGYSLPQFTQKYDKFSQKLHEFEKDPEAPKEMLDIVLRTGAKIGYRSLKRVPVLGDGISIIDEKSFSDNASNLSNYLMRKVTNNEERKLLTNPIEVLSLLFFEDLSMIARDQKCILFFDTFEVTRTFLEPWLLDFYSGNFGDASPNIYFIIAGHESLQKTEWSSFESIIEYIPLDVFNDDETLSLLQSRGVSDTELIRTITELSGNLPLLVATLASQSQSSPDKELLRSVTDTAVDRFLKWVTEPSHRQLALNMSLPLDFNLDNVGLFLKEEIEGSFDWLIKQPFVKKRGNNWFYHDLVREQMLRYSFSRSIESWESNHQTLIDFYKKKLKTMHITDDQWSEYVFKLDYHLLCLNPERNLRIILGKLVDNIFYSKKATFQYIRLLKKVGVDLSLSQLIQWSDNLNHVFPDSESHINRNTLDELSNSIDIDQNRYVIMMQLYAVNFVKDEQFELAIDYLSKAINLNTEDNWFLLVNRGEVYHNSNQFDKAAIDLSQAIELHPDDDLIYGWRGKSYMYMAKYQEAISDFDKAIELNPSNHWAIAHRGKVYRLLEQYDKAITDFDKAIELDPEYEWAIAHRGESYMLWQKYQKAHNDFDRAISLNPQYDWVILNQGRAFMMQGEFDQAQNKFQIVKEVNSENQLVDYFISHTYIQAQQFEEALSHINSVLASSPNDEEHLILRGNIHFQLTNYQQAITNFSKVIDFNPNSIVKIVAGLTESYSNLKKYNKAISIANRALDINPNHAIAFAVRGEVYRQMSQFDKALSDYDKAIELDVNLETAYANRGEVYRELTQFDAALTNFNKAIELNPDAWNYTLRGIIYSLMQENDKALQDCNNAIEIDPNYSLALANRSQIYSINEQFNDSLVDIQKVIRLDSENKWNYFLRGITYFGLKMFEDALADFDKAVSVTTKEDKYFLYRGETYFKLKQYENAIKDLEKATELNPDNYYPHNLRGDIFIELKQYNNSFLAYKNAVNLNPNDDWIHYQLFLLCDSQITSQDGKTHLEKAVEIATTEEESELATESNKLNLALYLLAANNVEEARKIYQMCCASNYAEL